MRFNDVIFDRFGVAKLRIREDGNIFTFQGQAIGFIKNDAVFNYQGLQVGWFEGGILRDLRGNTVGFGENPSSFPRPLLPIKQIKPIPTTPQKPTIPPSPEIRHIKPIKSFAWSQLGPEQIFYSRGYRNG